MRRLLLSITLLLMTEIANAQTIATMVNQVIDKDYFGGMAGAMGAISYVVGIAFAIKAVLKLREVGESKGKIIIPIVFFLSSSMFLSLPVLVKAGQHTIGINNSGAGVNSKY